MWLAVCFGLLGEAHPLQERAHGEVLATIRLETAATSSHILALEQNITLIDRQIADLAAAHVGQTADGQDTDLLLQSGDTPLTG